MAPRGENPRACTDVRPRTPRVEWHESTSEHGAMVRARGYAGLVAVAIACAGCTSSVNERYSQSTVGVSAPQPMSAVPTDQPPPSPPPTVDQSPAEEPARTDEVPATIADSIPIVNGAPDRGCVDVAGTLHAPAAAWYPNTGSSAPMLNGDRAVPSGIDAFQRTVTDVANRVAPQFTVTERFDFQRPGGGCVTHHYAVLKAGDDELLITTWRMESAGNPNWIANESSFATLDESTLVSRGSHVEVVLSVAQDGTTVRVTSYGSHAIDMVAGWPTTTAPRPSTPPPGPAALTIDQLLDIARPVLSAVLGSR